MKRVLIINIKLYKRILSPILSKKIHCRFYPTCSEYAILALEKYSLMVALKKIIKRLLRCNKYNTESCIDYP